MQRTEKLKLIIFILISFIIGYSTAFYVTYKICTKEFEKLAIQAKVGEYYISSDSSTLEPKIYFRFKTNFTTLDK